MLRRAARRLEVRSVDLVPEHFNRTEGYRAAVAVAVPLLVAVALGSKEMSWAVFAAFWTCLCDAPAPDRQRRQILSAFAVFGALIAFVGSWSASATPTASMVAGPVMVFLIILLSSAFPSAGLLGTLLAVVAVVAVGFPADPGTATVQALAYLGGAFWAFLLITAFWRLEPTAPLRHATHAVVLRLIDMAEALVATGDGSHRDAQWHSNHAEHRRAVRLAVERLNTLLERYRNEPDDTLAPFLNARDALEKTFNALIALDHAFIHRSGTAVERIATADAFRAAMLGWPVDREETAPDDARLRRGIDRIRRIRGKQSDPLMIGCLIALENATDLLRPSPDAPAEIPPRTAGHPSGKLRFQPKYAIRQTAGVVWVYYAAMVFGLGYPYWASMAVIVVLQGGARITWTRGLERILGSLLGGSIALLLLHATHSAAILSLGAILLAAVAIALRTVNYTVFVIFLTMLFIIVTEMLQPGTGIASARVLDNMIGSIAAMAAVFAIWPETEPSPRDRIERGVEAHRAYIEAVRSEAPAAEIRAARRAAGLASIEAEVAVHGLPGLTRRWKKLPHADASALKDLREMAGEGAVAWHRRLAIRTSRPSPNT
ncbi:FUSC family protein [Tropicimonas sediminicola]|uniref:Uncharacterized membrane protein YccC n=1 Tax=Tropicimonas sediminicola TaxID=1031541 RepID=A0A239LMC6_9RHOB|nr:FUSC family protein [Tropicimonas sediminicola]SNT31535.1 Uncharacterized membrane protein YccC [Tropicimonas sediminicola]